MVNIGTLFTPDVEHQASTLDLADHLPDFSQKTVLSRPRLTFSFLCNSTTVLNAFFVPFVTWRSFPQVQSIIKQYSFWRGNLHLKVLCTGNPSVMGNVRLFAFPQLASSDYGDPSNIVTPSSFNDFPRSSQLPHIDMDMSQGGSYELVLPYPSNLDFIDTLTTNVDWTCYIQELSPMVSVSGITPPSVKIEVYVYYDKMEFMNLIPQSGKGAVEGKTSWANILAQAATVTALIPFPYVSLASKVLGVGAAVAGAMGWSRAMTEAEQRVVLNTNGNWCIASGQDDMCKHMGTTPGQSSNVDFAQYPLGREDDMSIYTHLTSYSQLVKNWPVQTAVSIEPSLGKTGLIYPTRMAFFTSTFKFWRGGIKVKLVVHGSPLVRYRFGVMVVLPGLAVPTSFSAAGDYQVEIIEVSGSVEFEFMVPFAYPIWNLVDNRNSGVLDETRIVYFSLIDPSGPAAVAPQPYIDVWVAGADDYEVAHPNLTYVNNYLIAQSGPAPKGRAAYNFGEAITTINLLAKKPALVLSSIAATPSVAVLGDDGIPMDWTTNSNVVGYGPSGGLMAIADMGWSYSSYLRTAFIGYNGGSCWRGSASLGTNNIPLFRHFYANEFFPGADQEETSVFGSKNGLSGESNFTTTQIHEVAFPNLSVFNWKPAYTVHGLTGSQQTQMLFVQSSSEIPVGTIKYVHYHSAADDFTCGGFLCAPALQRIPPI